MEDLFSPCTRMRDLFESHSRRIPKGLQELNLNVCTEEFLSTESGLTYADLYAMLESTATVSWLTPHAAVARADGSVEQSWRHLDESCQFYFNVDGNVLYCLAFGPPSIYLKFAILFFDCWQQASFIQSLYTIGIIVMQHRSTLPV
jgi:hypothetical protein